MRSAGGRTMIMCSSTTISKAPSRTFSRSFQPNAVAPHGRVTKLAISSNGCSTSRNRATRSLPGSPGALHLTVTMSKAFTKETETEAEFDDELPALPARLKNYITPDGFRRLEDEFAGLQKSERPRIVETVAWAAGNGDRSENGDYIYGKRRLREIDRRLRFLRKRMEIAEVVDPARQKNHAQVYFGATVT